MGSKKGIHIFKDDAQFPGLKNCGNSDIMRKTEMLILLYNYVTLVDQEFALYSSSYETPEVHLPLPFKCWD